MRFLEIALLPIGGGKEKSAFANFKKHSKSVVATVKKFEDAMKAYADQDYEKGEELLVKVDELESKADKLGWKFESGLGAGAFLPAFRGHLSRLSERVDDVADSAEESIRCVYLRPKLFEDLSKAEEKDEEVSKIKEKLVELASKSVNCAVALDKAVSLLMEDMEEAADMAEEIHRCERKSDMAEEELLKELYKHEELLPPLTVMQIKDLIESIAGISDTAEGAGDILSAMIVAMKA
ncbi:MAG: DUF47 domain-containing protein [Hadesarchaea archaeon]|nr:DUF47 domain-containing protein [Hadesarchaea archaeon]